MPGPYDSKEYLDNEKWRAKSRTKSLEPSNCIAVWTDLCGFGSLLKKNHWDLKKMQESGGVHLLSQFHTFAGHPRLLRVDPYPNEKVIILNDGIAHTADLANKDKLDGVKFLFYFRDLLTTHYTLLKLTKSFKIGVRTVLAGGERVQYASAQTTGHSYLHYDKGKISEYGKKLLNTTYVYNPSEFQMNTAFAKAYTIDSLGSKENIQINGLYLESTFLELIRDIKDTKQIINKDCIDIYRFNKLVFRLMIADKFKIDLKGIDVEIYRLDRFIIFKEFDGDDLEFSLFR